MLYIVSRLDSEDDELWNETVSVLLNITTPLVII